MVNAIAKPPNMAMQPMPLRVRNILDFLKSGIGPNSFRSIGRGTADGQAVGPVIYAALRYPVQLRGTMCQI